MKFKSFKQKAMEYRKQGYSYNMISEKIGIAKSTLSYWLREIPYEPNEQVLKRIKRNKDILGLRAHRQKVATIKRIRKEAKKELGELSARDWWLLGVGLYLGDGDKSNEAVRVINSNPAVIKLAIKWFKEICGAKTRNLSLAIHAYPDNNIEETINYWSKKTGIPKQQFGKTQIDRRANKKSRNKGKLPHGTAHLIVKTRGDEKLGVNLHRRIIGWIAACLDQI